MKECVVDKILETIETFKLKNVSNLLEVEILAEFVEDYLGLDRSYMTISGLSNGYKDLSGGTVKSVSLASSIFKVLQENDIKPVHRINGCDRYSFYNFKILTDTN